MQMVKHGDINHAGQITRRSLLGGVGALVAAQLLAACSNQSREVSLRVQLLEDSIPVQLVREFQRRAELETGLSVSPKAQLADLFELLQTWKTGTNSARRDRPNLPFASTLNRSQPAPVADLVTLGDYWLAGAIQQNLIQPLAADSLPGWKNLPAAWQEIVRRDRQGQVSPNGEIWAAPYRWGTLVIAYRVQKFKELGWTPKDWTDLWRSELQGRISLLDSPRTVTGVVLKRLGASVNSENLDTISQLQPTLQQLHQQVKFYSSDAYLQPLLIGDTWIAVGWSTDILPVMERDRRISAIVPDSGTILTSDVWVRPAASANSSSLSSLAQEWINYCWQPDIATELSFLSSAASPILVQSDRSTLPRSIQTDAVRLPSPAVIDRSEFLEPLSTVTVEQYRQVWAAIRPTTNQFVL